MDYNKNFKLISYFTLFSIISYAKQCLENFLKAIRMRSNNSFN